MGLADTREYSWSHSYAPNPPQHWAWRKCRVCWMDEQDHRQHDRLALRDETWPPLHMEIPEAGRHP